MAPRTRFLQDSARGSRSLDDAIRSSADRRTREGASWRQRGRRRRLLRWGGRGRFCAAADARTENVHSSTQGKEVTTAMTISPASPLKVRSQRPEFYASDASPLYMTVGTVSTRIRQLHRGHFCVNRVSTAHSLTNADSRSQPRSGGLVNRQALPNPCRRDGLKFHLKMNPGAKPID